MTRRLPILVLIIGTLLSGCAWSYNGRTNEWRDKRTGVLIGCSQSEDSPIVPCSALPGTR